MHTCIYVCTTYFTSYFVFGPQFPLLIAPTAAHIRNYCRHFYVAAFSPLLFFLFPLLSSHPNSCHNSLYCSRQQTRKSATIAAISTVQHSPPPMPRRSPLLLHPLPFLSPSFKCVQLCVYVRCEAFFFFWTEACSRALFFLCQLASSKYIGVYIHDTRSPPTTRGLLSRFYLGCPASIFWYVCIHMMHGSFFLSHFCFDKRSECTLVWSG